MTTPEQLAWEQFVDDGNYAEARKLETEQDLVRQVAWVDREIF